MRGYESARILTVTLYDLEAFKEIIEGGELGFPVMAARDSKDWKTAETLTYHTLMKRPPMDADIKIQYTQPLEIPCSTHNPYGSSRSAHYTEDTIAVENSRAAAIGRLLALGVGTTQAKKLNKVKVRDIRSYLEEIDDNGETRTTHKKAETTKWSFEVGGRMKGLVCEAHLKNDSYSRANEVLYFISCPDLGNKRQAEAQEHHDRLAKYLDGKANILNGSLGLSNLYA